jgi:pyoverdine/dityrosine biosynthesis protein Dit1
MNTSTEILEVLKKGKYRKDHPYQEDKIREKIDSYVLFNSPIKFIAYWGVGAKNNPNWADTATCEFLTEMNNDVKKVYPPGIDFNFVIATPYGFFNGIPEKNVSSYINEMKNIFRNFGFNFMELSSLWEKHGINFERIDAAFKEKEQDPGWWEKIENREILECNSKARNHRYTPIISAKKFFIMRQLEKKMQEEEFRNFVFHIFSHSGMRNIMPDIPTLYFFPRKDWSDAPWFVDK